MNYCTAQLACDKYNVLCQPLEGTVAFFLFSVDYCEKMEHSGGAIEIHVNLEQGYIE